MTICSSIIPVGMKAFPLQSWTFGLLAIQNEMLLSFISLRQDFKNRKRKYFSLLLAMCP